jgi:hypothetical protein
VSDPFADYGKRAATIVSQPAALVGPLKRRSDARERYAEIVEGLRACRSEAELETYITSIRPETIQFSAELIFLWTGEGNDFPGLRHEIELARASFDAGLDLPRWEPAYSLSAHD